MEKISHHFVLIKNIIQSIPKEIEHKKLVFVKTFSKSLKSSVSNGEKDKYNQNKKGEQILPVHFLKRLFPNTRDFF